jgi:GT2 family glycosyltransferase
MLSILIVNWNTRDLLRECLQSLVRFPPSSDYETIVVDNASTDGSAEMVRSEFPSVILIDSKVNTGYAKGNNLAFESASGDLLLTLNPDTEFRDDSLDRAISVLKSNPRYGALGAKQIALDGSTQHSVRGFPSILGIAGDLLKMKTGPFGSYRLSDFDYEQEQPAPQPMGTFLMFRREALASIGDPQKPFDESFPIFFNEVDLLYRLKQSNWPCLYSPEVRVIHHGGEGTKQVRKNMIWESHRSLVRFLRKHLVRWWNAPLYWLVFVMVYVGAFVRARGYSAGFRS